MSEKTTVWENVKVKKTVVDKLRTHKKKTGVSIMAFVELAIFEKLDVLKRWEPIVQKKSINKPKK